MERLYVTHSCLSKWQVLKWRQSVLVDLLTSQILKSCDEIFLRNIAIHQLCSLDDNMNKLLLPILHKWRLGMRRMNSLCPVTIHRWKIIPIKNDTHLTKYYFNKLYIAPMHISSAFLVWDFYIKASLSESSSFSLKYVVTKPKCNFATESCHWNIYFYCTIEEVSKCFIISRFHFRFVRLHLVRCVIGLVFCVSVGLCIY